MRLILVVLLSLLAVTSAINIDAIRARIEAEGFDPVTDAVTAARAVLTAKRGALVKAKAALNTASTALHQKSLEAKNAAAAATQAAKLVTRRTERLNTAQAALTGAQKNLQGHTGGALNNAKAVYNGLFAQKAEKDKIQAQTTTASSTVSSQFPDGAKKPSGVALDTVQQDLTKFYANLAKAKSELDAATAQNSNLQGVVKTAQGKVDRITKKLAEAKTAADAAGKKLEAANTALNAASTAQKLANDAVTKARTEYHDAIRAVRKALQDRLNKYKSDLNGATQAASQAAADVTAKQNNKNSLETLANRLKTRIADLTAKLDATNKELTAAKADHAAAIDAHNKSKKRTADALEAVKVARRALNQFATANEIRK